VTSWLAHYGVFAILVLMAIDAVFPAASELVMLYGGALASGALAHELDVAGWHTTGFAAYITVVVAGVVGYQIGSNAGWWIGRRGGRRFVERYGRWLHLSTAQLDRADRWFDRWDVWAVFLGRVTPVARSFVSIPAGVFESPFARYNILTLLGNGAWCIVLAAVGWALGSSWHSFDHGCRDAEIAVVAGIVIAVAYWSWRRRRPGTLPSYDDSPR
jgi:membrane protein DedA with SNARE-associated domain